MINFFVSFGIVIFCFVVDILFDLVHDVKAIFHLPEHYANTPMQYTAILHGCKNDNFQMIF